MFGKILKFVFIVLAIITITTIISVIIPQPLTEGILSAFTYFLGYLNYLQPIANVSTLFICIKLLLNFFLSYIIILALNWLTLIFFKV